MKKSELRQMIREEYNRVIIEANRSNPLSAGSTIKIVNTTKVGRGLLKGKAYRVQPTGDNKISFYRPGGLKPIGTWFRKDVESWLKSGYLVAESMIVESIDVNTEQYEFSHGKKPSGTGSWAFRFEKNRGGRDGEMFWPDGRLKYKDALAAAKEEAKRQGIEFIIVMP